MGADNTLGETNFNPMKTKWIPCNERMPEGEVLLLTASRMRLIGDWYRGVWRSPGQNYWEDDQIKSRIHNDDITHWQPLPSTDL